jgi:FKBP-type peptidyl-prolyl cis-trans isomerase
MKAMVYAAGLMAAVIATPSLAADLSTIEKQISYSIGYKIGKSLKIQEDKGMKVDLDVIKEAITDTVNDKPLQLTEDQMKAAFKELQKQMQEKARAEKGK